MATNATRKARGLKTQDIIAQWFIPRGYPFAQSTGSGRGGVDVTGMPGLAIEAKARAKFSPLAWIKQAKASASEGDLPVVVIRPNGMGPASVADWPVMLRLEDFTRLARAAGYGDPEVAA